jgi:hypothetical protein
MVKNKVDIMIEKAIMMEEEIKDRRKIKSNNMCRKIYENGEREQYRRQ